MDKPLVLKTNAEPTYFNKEAAIGLFLFPPVGTVIAAYIGKSRMENEKAVGKVIEEPTMFNKDMLLGFLIGSTIGGAVAQAALVATVISTPLAVGALAVAAAATLIGTYVGGSVGKEKMAQEQVLATIQQQETIVSRSHSQGYDAGISYSQNHAKSIEQQRAQSSQLGIS